MAVTKIRKTSSTILLVVAAISVIVMLMFYFGGYIDPAAANPEPKFTGLLLYWTYAMFALGVLMVVIFGISAFIAGFKHNPKKAVRALIMIALFAVLMVVTYFLGSAEKLNLSSDFQAYNTAGWLKVTDMFLYTTYVMAALCVLGIIVGSIVNMIRK